MAKHYEDSQTKKHIPYKDNKALTGTIRYASVNTHLGIESSRRDDLEALGYILIYLSRGALPWQGLKAKTPEEKVQAIIEKKISTSIETLCKDLPCNSIIYEYVAEFLKYMKYIRETKFEQKPDYQYLRKLFRDLYLSKYNTLDFKFDWTIKHVLFYNTHFH